jgi:hypothetical protein
LSETQPEAASTAQPLRQRLLDYLRDRIGEVGKHAMIRTKDIAAHFSVTPVTIAKHLHALAQEGYVRTKAAGPKGTIISIEAGPRRTAGGGRGRTAHETKPIALRRVGNQYFCPWCGSKVQRVWRFCNRCGERLPK